MVLLTFLSSWLWLWLFLLLLSWTACRSLTSSLWKDLLNWNLDKFQVRLFNLALFWMFLLYVRKETILGCKLSHTCKAFENWLWGLVSNLVSWLVSLGVVGLRTRLIWLLLLLSLLLLIGLSFLLISSLRTSLIIRASLLSLLFGCCGLWLWLTWGLSSLWSGLRLGICSTSTDWLWSDWLVAHLISGTFSLSS